MRIQSITSTLFKGEPNNYAKIDEHVSRSAQPLKEDLTWLKEQGITDVINFRTMYAPAVDFDEAEELKKLGIDPEHADEALVQYETEISAMLEEMKGLVPPELMASLQA